MDILQSNCKEPRKQICFGEPEGYDLDEMTVDYRTRYHDAIEEGHKALATYTDFICGAPNKKEGQNIKKYCKNSHQFRMPSTTVFNAYKKLMAAGLERYDTFGEIHAAVHEATRDVKQFGLLANYDFTQRYCYSRGIKPDGVYLHAGVAIGARELKKMGYSFKVIDLGNRGSMIELSSLPAPIAALGALHAESFLCIYKHLLAKAAKSKK